MSSKNLWLYSHISHILKFLNFFFVCFLYDLEGVFIKHNRASKRGPVISIWKTFEGSFIIYNLLLRKGRLVFSRDNLYHQLFFLTSLICDTILLGCNLTTRSFHTIWMNSTVLEDVIGMILFMWCMRVFSLECSILYVF